MINNYLIFIIITILYIIITWIIYNNYKKYKLKFTWYPVKHRLDDKGRLQYSIDGKLWTYIMGYNPKTNYGNYIGPGFSYITFKSNNDEEYIMWCNMLYTLQKCHEWNISALNHYREAIDKYLETNKN